MLSSHADSEPMSAYLPAMGKKGCKSARSIYTNVVVLVIATFKTVSASELWLAFVAGLITNPQAGSRGPKFS